MVGDEHGVSLAIQDDIGRAQHLAGFGRHAGAAKDRADAGQKLAHAEGLGDVVIRAQFQAGDLVGLLQAGGQQDDGGLAFLAKCADELKAIHLGHHDIEQDEIGLLVTGGVEGVLAVVGDDDAQPLFCEVIAHEGAHVRLVVHNEDGLGHGDSSVGCQRAWRTGRETHYTYGCWRDGGGASLRFCCSYHRVSPWACY